MAAESFECQIAQLQLNRYVAGESLSAETIRDLEAHLGDCPDCQQVLAEKREALLEKAGVGKEAPAKKAAKPKATPPASKLGKAINAQRAVVSIEETEEDEPVVEEAPVTRRATAARVQPNLKLGLKPLGWSAALAAVLLAMSYAGKNASTWLGPKANQTTPAAESTPAPAPTAKPSPVASPTPAPVVAKKPEIKIDPTAIALMGEVGIPESIQNTEFPQTEAPTLTPVRETVPTEPVRTETTAKRTIKRNRTSIRKARTKATARTTRRTPTKRAKTRAPKNSVRVYDSEGRPIQ
ncbi:MAG: zf-HC2 domain-containing protein [Armatimonadetes bacterium]|nr:zf-HC2 domain-containing protein [Armatimonadota bacterium]